MKYEDKLKIMKKEGKIAASLVEPVDYFRFLRDGCMTQLTYKLLNGHKNLYEIHCKPSVATESSLRDLFNADDISNTHDVDRF